MTKTVFCAMCILVSGGAAMAQDVVVDWSAKKVTSQPSSVEKNMKVNVRVDQVNDLMFTYSISYTLKPLDIADFNAIGKAFTLAGGAAKAAGEAANVCNYADVLATQEALRDAEAEFVKTPATEKGCSEEKPCDISLQRALRLFEASVQPKIGAAQLALDAFTASCSSSAYAASVKSAREAIDAAIAKYKGPHSIVKPNAVPLSPEATTSLEVDQLYNGKPTTNGTYTVDLQSSNHRLTLSAGALFSEIQNRSYTSQSAPNAAGTGTSNVLNVNGTGHFSPTAVALLNYELPFADWERWGLAVSTGPVFRLGSKSDTSSFGFFAGISAHLFHRFYVTPGFHFGQFADFPAGFSVPNQAVPAGLATPTPTTRWTWRFGFGLTYRAKDFSQFGVNGSVTPAKDAGAKLP
ncbi:MAG: hypothetical protein QM757_25950 [Paludibaculum sp.]